MAMDPRDRFLDEDEADKRKMEAWQTQMWTALPILVEKHDTDKNTSEIQPAIKLLQNDDEGNKKWVQFPVLKDVPILYYGGGGSTLTVPITKGDEGVVVFSSRSIDKWWDKGGVQEQTAARMHDISDGFLIPGLRSQPRKLKNVSKTTFQLRTDKPASDGGSHFEFDPAHGTQVTRDGIPIKPSITMTIESAIKINSFAGSILHAAGVPLPDASSLLNNVGNIIHAAGKMPDMPSGIGNIIHTAMNNINHLTQVGDILHQAAQNFSAGGIAKVLLAAGSSAEVASREPRFAAGVSINLNSPIVQASADIKAYGKIDASAGFFINGQPAIGNRGPPGPPGPEGPVGPAGPQGEPGATSFQAGPGLKFDYTTTPPTIDVVTPYLPLLYGGTLNGDLGISKAYPTIYLSNSSGASQIIGQRNSLFRWLFRVGSDDVESGGNVGSDFTLHRYADDGSIIAEAFRIKRATGDLTNSGNILSTSVGNSGQFRMAANANGTGYGSFWRNDSGNTYLLLTNNNDAFGIWNDLRPFYVENYNGLVHMNNGLILDKSTSSNVLTILNSSGTNLKIFDDGNSHIESSTRLWLNGVTGAPATFGGPLTVSGAITISGALTTPSSITAAAFEATGTNAIYGWRDRASNTYWAWYAQNGFTRLYNLPSGDLIKINETGFVTIGQGDDPVRPLMVHRASYHDPLEIRADTAYYARIRYHVKGIRIWSAGACPDGTFMIADESAGAGRFTIQMNGDLGIAANLTIGGTDLRFQNASSLGTAGGGPVVYGDTNWIVAKPGTGNQGFMVYDSSANSICQITPGNRLYLGNTKFLEADWANTGYNKIFQNNGANVAMYIGTGTTHYRNDVHRFDSSDSSGTQSRMVLDGNVHINQGNIYMDGNGAVMFNNNISLYWKDNTNAYQPVIYLANNNWIYIALNGQPIQCNGTVWINNHIYPTVDNALICGGNGYNWSIVSAYAYPGPSDIREKKDITNLPDNCVDLVKSIVPRRFRWNHGIDQEKVHWGFIAQNVGEVMREHDLEFGGHIINEDEAKKQLLNVNELTAVLWRAVQDLASKVEILEDKLTTLH